MTLLIDVLLFRAYSPPSPSLSGIYPTFFPPILRTLDRYSRRCTKSLASWPVDEKNSCYRSHLVASYQGDRQADPCVRRLTLLHADSVSLRGLPGAPAPQARDRARPPPVSPDRAGCGLPPRDGVTEQAPRRRRRAGSHRARELRQERRDERSEEHTSELQSRQYLVCRLLLEKKKKKNKKKNNKTHIQKTKHQT